MSLSTKYNPQEVESKIYKEWMERGFFHSEPNSDKEPFTIIMPPPNVTGVLHMGHMLNNTIQDVLIRKARMEGKEACWVPGTDHASIATEAKVVGLLREQGIIKADLTRDEFLEHAHQWKDKYGGIILDQLKKLGASCDWDRTFFTMSPKLSKAVIDSFIDLHKKGYIYRDYKMVNWDPQAQTTISNEEVIHKEVDSALYYVNYQLEGSDEFVTIATTRPETILGDSAICINPNDERYTHLKGKRAIVPMVNRSIPIIEDEYVDLEFGTGCLKVTPAHDTNDYELGKKHNLETIDILNDDGTLSAAAQFFVGVDRVEARKLISKELKSLGLLTKVENFKNKVGFSERNPDTVVEPKLSLQWYVNMKEIVKPALENVMNDNIQFYPPKFKKTYKHWLDNIRDWPISRQLWWGQQIPAYYYGENGFAIASTKEEALEIARKDSGNANLQLSDLKQDEDVVDTWFSSWLAPISVFDGFENPGNPDINYYYPTSVLVTGWDIIFFWVARMIFAGYEFMNEMPFKKVYFTGMVRDLQRRKMSKSLGNSPEALKLIDQYGADGVRVGMLLSSAAGNDLLFDEKLCEQGRNFSTKIWNAFRLVKNWEIAEKPASEKNKIARDWFDARFNQVLAESEDNFTKFRLSDSLMSIYKLIWDDFCSWYLEIIKPDFGKPIDRETYDTAIGFFEKLMRLVHPYMPFISEEIWQNIAVRESNDYVIVAEWPKAESFDEKIISAAEVAFELISNIRNIRNSNGISFKNKLDLYAKTGDFGEYSSFKNIISRLGNLDTFEECKENPVNSISFTIRADEFFIPAEGNVDVEKEKAERTKELEYTQGFLNSIAKKLSNERFVNNAPEQVVAVEKKKQADAEEKIKMLEEKLKGLG
ncbi:MAG: valyl-tRNA synthetase [Cyclobacteriaceae bacterium]|jgi:valyl-tRNA synthetase